ncbi:hypothetical protein F7725_019845 [Dissostichus mawsoni]|uniref:Uncharacterized protein n=1 Tax=Dissostichus mawsoni TaxID=36200 RepID=A0A7J5YKV5_DISMA|nr:hypothetical protein F7725_019845 [Dissostichus mawsoni]
MFICFILTTGKWLQLLSWKKPRNTNNLHTFSFFSCIISSFTYPRRETTPYLQVLKDQCHTHCCSVNLAKSLRCLISASLELCYYLSLNRMGCCALALVAKMDKRK